MPRGIFKRTKEHRMKISLALKGRKFSDRTKEKLRKLRLGKKASEETKKRMSLAHKGRKGYWEGKKMSKEHREKMSESHPKGSQHPNWKGGQYKNDGGYVYILQKSHPFCNWAGYVRRSRLVMEKYLGRYLKPTEIMHHINKIRDDDRLENLKLFSNNSEHIKYEYRNKKSHINSPTVV